MNDCIFCKIIKKEIPSQIVYEDGKVVAFLDIMPINKGHVLVVPKEHAVDMLESSDNTLNSMICAAKKIAKSVVSAVKADGFNIGINTKPAAGQAVFHTHFHIIPRFKDDGLKHWPHQKLSKEEMEKVQKEIQELI